jgi:predicted ABC-type transport system involved in lysophospholipase L1 biosynthesis ATPase subunit
MNSTAFPSAAVRTLELTKTYGTASAPVHALRGVTVTIQRGERVALLGKSGSGKSTLLNLLGGLDAPTAGSVEVAGRELAELTSSGLARHRLATVGMIFQAFNLILSRTALQNVELPMVFAGKSRRERRAAARRSLEAVGLGHRLDHRPSELSGGEHQRVAIARALVNDPQVLLADEPTGNLDSSTTSEIMDWLSNYVRVHGTTLILVTHDEELAGRYTDRVIRLKDGQLHDGT